MNSPSIEWKADKADWRFHRKFDSICHND